MNRRVFDLVDPCRPSCDDRPYRPVRMTAWQPSECSRPTLGGYTAAALAGARLNTAVLQAVYDGDVPPGRRPLDELRRRITDPQAGAADTAAFLRPHLCP